MNYNSDVIFANMKEILSNVDRELLSDETLNFLDDFNNLSKDNQHIIFNSFLSSLSFLKDVEFEQKIKDSCAINGHIYSPWYESVSFDNYKGASFKNKIWCKKCQICGYVDFTFVRPGELIEIKKSDYKIKKREKNVI